MPYSLRDLVSPTVGQDSLRTRLLRGGVGSIFVKGISIAFAFGVSVILARTLGPNGFGIYSYVFALASLLSIPAQFGLPNLVVRETAKAHARSDWSMIRGLWTWSNSIAGAISITIALASAILVLTFADRFDVEMLATFGFGIVLIPLTTMGSLRGAALRGLRLVVLGELPELVVRPGMLILLVGVVILLLPSRELGPAEAMALHVMAAVVAFVVGIALLRSVRPPEIALSDERSYLRPEWTRAVVPLALTGGFQMLNQHVDVIMLGVFATAEEVGIYKVVAQGGAFVIFGLQVINLVVAPHIARLYGLNELANLQRMVRAGARVSLVFALPVALCFVFFGSTILHYVFGEAYANGAAALAIISIGQTVNAGVGSVAILLNMTGHEKDTTIGVAIAAACNVFLNLLLIPRFGMVGAATATAATLIVWNLLLSRKVYKRLGIRSHGF